MKIILKFAFLLFLVLGLNVPAPVFAIGNAALARDYLVQLKTGTDVGILSRYGEFQPVLQHEEIGAWYKLHSVYTQDELKKVLVDEGRAASVQEDFLFQTSAVSFNDPWFTDNSADTDMQWALSKSGFLEAWQYTTGKPNVIVAVIDTGVDATHEDLSGSNIMTAYDVETKRELVGVSDSDRNGHGTLVAGVIAGKPGNGKGVVGAAYGVSVLPVRALDDEGSGTSSTVSAGIVYAVDKGASVINLSLGGIGFAHDLLLANSIEYAYRKGVVVVAAAGNDAAVTGGSLDVNPVFPICNDNGENMVLGVTALDSRDLKPGFANFGKACIDVSAPGRRIISTINHDPISGVSAPNSYAYASGTSLAVPFVSSQAALLKSLYQAATPRQIIERIVSTAENVDNLNLSQCEGFSCKGLLGAGRIRVLASLTQPIMPAVQDGDLVKSPDGRIYLIQGGRRRGVIDFVKTQRFVNIEPKNVSLQDIAQYPEGALLEPVDGTLVKRAGDNTVYYIDKGVRMAVTYQVFLDRGFEFARVVELDQSIINSWVMGSFLAPKEGTLVKASSQTVYWVVGGVLHPINYNFWKHVGLDIFPIMRVNDGDLKSFPIGEAYIR